jgi:D-cysteine desulfhydrase family pyridoxal phosphate-dependent enzyme
MADCPLTSHPGSALERLRSTGRLALGHWPTPLREMPRLRAALGCAPRLWIKHDDWSGPGFGGNKVRKLEYYFAKALAQSYDAVITCGGVRSNHCRVTAALAAQLGLECHLVLNGGSPALPASPILPASLWLDEMYGAFLRPVASREQRVPAMEEAEAELRAQGKRAMVIPLGASTALGALGFVQAAGELLNQCEQAGFQPDWVVHSTSSGGTQAGLVAGLKLFGARSAMVLGVSADDPAASIGGAVQHIIAQMEVDLGAAACALQGDILVDDRHTGSGYGVPSPEGEEATRLLARTEGVLLDPVYSAKAMAGLMANLGQGPLAGASEIVFWHTGGQLAQFVR